MKIKQKRKIKKQMTVFTMLVCLLAGLFGSITVFASTFVISSNEFAQADACFTVNFIPSNSGINHDVKYNITSANSDILYFAIRDIDTCSVVVVSKSSSISVKYDYYEHIFDSNGESYRLHSGNSCSGYVSSYNGYYMNYICTFATTKFNVSGNVVGTFDLTKTDKPYYELIGDYLTGIVDDSFTLNIPSFDQSTAVYDSNIGYLKDIVYQNALVNGAYDSTMYHEFRWNTLTTTGCDLTKDDYDVQYYFKVNANYTALSGSSGTVGPYQTDTYNVKDTSDYCYKIDLPSESGIYYDLLQKVRNELPFITLNESYTRQLYLRPVAYSGGQWKYGGWTRVTFDSNGGSTVDNMFESHYTADDMESDGQGGDTGNVDNSYSGSSNMGTGSDIDSAINNGNSSATVNTDVVDNAKSIVSQIGEVPVIISEIFSFLPQWCINLFGVGFGAVMVLIIYKLIRG